MEEAKTPPPRPRDQPFSGRCYGGQFHPAPAPAGSALAVAAYAMTG